MSLATRQRLSSSARIALLVLFGFAARSASAEDQLTLAIELGPITGAPNDSRSITFNAASRTKRRLHDAADGQQHFVRGVPLAELVKRVGAPKRADTVVLGFSNGMQVPVRLSDKAQIQQLFIAFEHGDALGAYNLTYPLAGGGPAIPCPKIVYEREGEAYTIWRYTTQLTSVRFVTEAVLESNLAQPSRQLPTHPGWKLYSRHCQACHGMGGQGAKLGPDFISDLDAYRRVPALAESDPGEQPSLHEKVKGRAPGQMPTLQHVTSAEIKALWRFLHTIHAGATK